MPYQSCWVNLEFFILFFLNTISSPYSWTHHIQRKMLENNIQKLTLPSRIPNEVEDLVSEIIKTFSVPGEFELLYEDKDFGNQFFTITSTAELEDKATVKLVRKEPLITLDLCPLEESGLSSTPVPWRPTLWMMVKHTPLLLIIVNRQAHKTPLFSLSHIVLLHGQCCFKCQRFPVTLNLSLQRLTSHTMPLENISMMQVSNLQ